jgi:hypothetical protein
MTTATTTTADAPQTTLVTESKRAYQILHVGYTVAPIATLRQLRPAATSALA